MFDRFKKGLDLFCQTLRAGYYTPPTGKENDTPGARSLPKTPRMIATFTGAAVMEVVLGVAGLLSTTLVTVTSAGLALAAAAVMGLTYFRCRKTADETIREVNMAGQEVIGTRRDLYLLHSTQKKIVRLSEAFDEAVAPRLVDAEVNALIDETNAARSRIRVIAAGDAPGHRFEYDFVRPVIRLRDAIPAARKPLHA